MKYIVTIEETVSQEFAVDAENMEEAMKTAEQKYRNGEFVLYPGNLEAKQMSGRCSETNETSDWVEF